MHNTLKARERLYGWLLAWMLLAAAVSSNAAQVTATVDRPTITLGETVTLTITFDGVGSASTPQLPALPGFQVAGSGQHSEMGPGYMRVAYDYQLAATQAGEFTIPAFQIRAGNQVYSTQPLKVTVLKPGSSVPGGAGGAPAAFLRMVMPKPEAFVGEMLEVELRLYALEGEMEQPQFAGDGFSFGKLSAPAQTQAVENNQRYNLVTFKCVVTPLRPGALTLGPVSMGLHVADRTRAPDFFGFRSKRRLALATDPVPLTVLPVPTQGAPPAFTGAVGQYTIQATAAPAEVTVGDPVTLKIQISGRGPLEGLQLPTQTAWQDFKTYPAEGKVAFADNLGMSGVKTFEQVVIPQNHEIKALPPFEFSFFDPEVRAFRTVSSPTLALKVRPAAGGAGPVPTLTGVSNRTERAPRPPEIAPIKVHLGSIAPGGTPLFQRRAFLMLQTAPVALWLWFFSRRQYRESLSRNPRLVRQRQVTKVVAEGLRQVRDHAQSNAPEAFYAGVFRLLQEQIGERLDLPASAITEAVVDEHLGPGGVNPELLAQVHDLFQECNLARYAPPGQAAGLAARLPVVERVLEQLKTLPDPK
jgi:hypothetical protein